MPLLHTYATAQDYAAILGEQEALEASNLDNPHATTINEAALNEVLTNVSGQANSYLATRYQVPVSPTPPLLKRLVVILARCDLDRYVRREHVQSDCENALAELLRIAQGKQILLDANNQVVPPIDTGQGVSFGRVGYGAGCPTFTRSNLADYGRGWGGN